MTRTHRNQGRERNRVGQQRARRARRLLLEALEDRRLLAFDAQLVADINVLQSSDASSSPEYIVQVGAVAYFTAETPTAGRELWRSDGTAAGTFMVKDINAGAGDAFYSGRDPFLTNVNGTLFFTANDGVNGYELWKSDGTEAGTELVKVINTRDGSSLCEPALLTELNGLLFFRAGAATYDMYGPELDGGPELWVSDGTEAGTKRVKDIDTTGKFGGSQIREITNFNGTLFFRADDGIHGSELWKSDGTEANTVMVKDLRPGNQYSHSGPSYLTPVGGKLFFVARDDEHHRELWVSDGTEANTYMVKDIGNHWGEPWHLTAVGDTLFFYANDGSSGWELWKSDGTAANTVMVKDIKPGPGTSTNTWNSLTNVNGTLFFNANDGTHGYELWKSDGTEANTVRVKDTTGSAPSGLWDLTNVNGTLFFTAYDEAHGHELWKTDGTPANTVLIKDIHPGSGSAYPGNLANINGTLFFSANDGSSHYELWKSDGTAENTVLVKDLNTATQNSSPRALAEIGDTVFFSANDGTNGFELWKSDGTAANAVLVKDINAGSGDSYPCNLTNVNGTLFFSANDGTNGYQLWKSDGTPGGTVPVKNLSAGGWDSLAELTNVNGTLFFRANDGVNGYELWRSDGTEANTVLVKDINGGGSSYPKHLTNVNGTLFFRADDDANGYELWKSDGTAANTVLVKDINPGSADSLGSWNDTLTNVNGTLFFSANDGASGYELWKSDGTAENTVRVKDIYVGTDGSYPDYLTNVNGTLFFSTDDGIHGRELWKSDGTAENTVLVKDIRPGDRWADSYPRALTAVGGTLFFTARDDGSVYGRELWKSDGTEANTVIVKDIWPGTTTSYPGNLTNGNGTLFFTAEDGLHGRELWASNGTARGTVLVKDIRPGGTGSYPDYLTTVNGTLLFTADDGLHGTELWQGVSLPSTSSLLAELDPNGNLVISDDSPAGVDNQITVEFSDGNLVITDANEPFAPLSEEIVNAGGALSNEDRTLTIPLAAVTGSVTIRGADGEDGLVVTGGTFDAATKTFTNASDGHIVFAGGPTIHYTGLEPVDISGCAIANLVFHLPVAASEVVLEDDGTAGNGISQLRSALGTFETTAFANPSGSVTIHRGNSADTLRIEALPDFNASLTVGSAGEPFSELTFVGALTLAADKHLAAYSSGTIDLPTADSDLATAGAGAVSLTAAEVIALATGASVMTDDGGNGQIVMTADRVTIDGSSTIDSGLGTTTIRPFTPGTPIDLGGDDVLAAPSATLGLTNADLERFAAGTLRIGDAASGTIRVTADIARPDGTDMVLTSGGDIVIDGGQVTIDGGTLRLAPGAAPAAVRPVKPGTDVAAGKLSFASTLAIDINGTVADADYTQLNVDGTVDLTGVELTIGGDFPGLTGWETFTIVTATDVTGEFVGLPHGTLVDVQGKPFAVHYRPAEVWLVPAGIHATTTGGGNVMARVSKRNLVVTGDHAANSIRILAGATPGEWVVSGIGETTVNGKPQETLSGVTQDVWINMQGGDDYVLLQDVSVPRNLAVDLGAGNNLAALVSASTGRHLNARASAPAGRYVPGSSGRIAQIDVYLLRSPVGANAHVSGSAGSDRVCMTDSVVHGDLTARLGGGTDEVQVRGGQVGRDLIVQSSTGNDTIGIRKTAVQRDLRIEPGTGEDGVSLSDIVAGRNATIRLDRGLNTVEIDRFDVFARFTLTGGRDADRVLVGTERTGGLTSNSASFSMGSGNDTLVLLDSAFGELAVDMGAGDTEFYLEGNEVARKTRLRGGRGSSKITENFEAKNDLAALDVRGLDEVLSAWA